VIRVAIFGASGFTGGELLRILLWHPEVEVAAATSRTFAGRRVDVVHPHLRDRTDLTFRAVDDLGGDFDALFMATPHGTAMRLLPELMSRAKQVIDLSADFRIRDEAAYNRYYGSHAAPHLVDGFVLGLPELYRAELRGADRVAVPGCMATAAILALHPVAADGLAGPDAEVDARTGSSGSGTTSGPAGSHQLRSGAMRVYTPFGHRHEAEISQATGLPVRMTATGVEAVRGVQVLCRTNVAAGTTERDLWALYRRHYRDEPFVRLVRQRRGAYRFPEPKILTGSNFCDVGLSVDESGRALLIAALDNLGKGAAGNAVQCLNVRNGWPERCGLEFPGLHPI
jgi:N-acetyl-gamma-glutamyl-phosphate/LysW-gamma-L-alpha-aminoadipyl-6-phosphate reductase